MPAHPHPIRQLSDEQRLLLQERDPELFEELLVDWQRGWFPDAREAQVPPEGEWDVWVVQAGRGFGKTRTGAEEAAEWMDAESVGFPTRGAVVARTFADARDTCIEGESGLLAVLERRGFGIKKWNRSVGELFLRNGSQVKLFSDEKPDALRGPQHHWAWCDEFAAWENLDEESDRGSTWAMLEFGLRLGAPEGSGLEWRPRVIVTTTPRPRRALRELIRQPGTVVTRGSTMDNAANLAPAFLKKIMRHDGTKLGRQELYGELLDDESGLAFERSWFERRWRRVRVGEGDLWVLGDGRSFRPDECVRFASIDLAAGRKTSRDYTVVASWAVTPDGDLLALELVARRLTERQHFAPVQRQHQRWGLEQVVLEKSQYATELVRAMSKHMPEVPLHSIQPEGDKLTRAIAASEQVPPERWWFPEDAEGEDGWLGSFVDQAVEFTGDPNSGHDDMVDVFAYACHVASRMVPTARKRRRQSDEDERDEFWKAVRQMRKRVHGDRHRRHRRVYD